jgi:hypothetical protein
MQEMNIGSSMLSPMMSPISPVYEPINMRAKKGHICCGYCCDVRRAVIILNLLNILLSVLWLALFTAGYDIIENSALNPDADDAIKEEAALLKTLPMGLLIFLGLLQICCYAVGIMGAIHFDRRMLKVAIGWYAMSLFANLVQFQVLSAIATLLFIYPLYYLDKEIKENIMTPENYPNEVQSCCCI